MKDYKEMAESVFERRDKYNAERNKLKKGAAGAVCCCLVAILGAGALNSDLFTPDIDNSGIQDLGGKYGADVENDPVVWQSANEILEGESGGDYAGLMVPTFISYRGGFYGSVDYDAETYSGFAPMEDKLFSPKCRHNAYQVKDHPDCIAIVINGMEVYQKIFDVTFEVDGVTYGIEYSPIMDADYTYGEVIQNRENFTVYQAVRLQGEPAEEAEYLVNIQPLLKDKLPNLFGDDETYAEAWQLALPLDVNQ